MDKYLINLEYDKVLEKIAAHSTSPVTKGEIFLRISPKTDLKSATLLLDQTEEAYRLFHVQNLNPLVPFDDAAAVIQKSRVAAMLTPSELRRVFFLLRAGRTAKKMLHSATGYELLKSIIDRYSPQQSAKQSTQLLEKEIETAILSDTEISDFASEKLRSVRKKLAAAKAHLAEKIKQYSRSSEISKFLQDDLVTIREGRYVLPVKSESRSSVPGLIHDRSASGSTVFVEPFAVVEMNNEIRALILEEQSEIERILTALTVLVAAAADELEQMQDALIELDIIFSRMYFSAEFDCARPKLNNTGRINLVRARHPLIPKERVVPVTLLVGDDCQILAITGPNTGGKTVALKTAGLFCLLACSGVFLPAAGDSEVAVFDAVFSDIGDEQSITSSLSTFSSHIKNIAFILENITKNSLVLFDELGGGTDPDEGAALAIGILKFLEKVGCTGILTTHFGQLKEYALSSKTVKNASMQFDEQSLRPTYRLISGVAGSSNALKIAGTLGISDFIILEAQKTMSKERLDLAAALSNAEDAAARAIAELGKIERERAETQRLRNEAEELNTRLKERLESINARAGAEVKRLVSSSAAFAAELVDEIKSKVKQADEQALLEARRAYNRIENIRYESGGGVSVSDDGDFGNGLRSTLVAADEKDIVVGAEMLIISLGVSGRVLSVNTAKKEALVQAGAGKTQIKFDNLALVYAKKSGGKKVGKKAAPQEKAEAGQVEVNVLGLTVAEAIEVLDPIILSGESGLTLRIIHGKGTGALGRGIQQYLKNEKRVNSYRYGRYGEGETGVTIAELK